MKKFRSLALFAVFLLSSMPAWADVEKTDILDGTGGLVGLLAVLFFMWLCFWGDKHLPEGLAPKKQEDNKQESK